jgi:GNAT superfamily N-acetyltransferase
MTVRPMTADDLADVARLSGDLGYPIDAPQAAERFGRLSANREHGLFVAEEAGRVVGWIHVTRSETLTDAPLAEIDALIVDAQARSRGVGRRLVAAAETWAASRGHETLRVRTRITRDRAHNFYRKSGFTLNKTQHVFDKSIAGNMSDLT